MYKRKFVRTARFWNNLHQVYLKRTYLNIRSKKNKRPEQNSQHRLRSPLSEVGVP